MKYELKEIEDQIIWNDFVKKSKYQSFLQSWEWGQFQHKGMNKKVWYLGIYSGEKIIAISLCLEEKLRYGSFIYCPRGPIVDWESENYKEVIEDIKEYFIKKGYFCIRMDPSIPKDGKEEEVFRSLRFKDAITTYQTERPWILDISKTEEDILSGMRIQTRYNVNKAGRTGGLVTTISRNKEDLDIFLSLIKEMSIQKGFHTYPSSYFYKMFEHCGDVLNVVVTKFNNNPVSAIILTTFGDEACYIHGANAREEMKLRASYLLQWEAIKYAKSLGIKKYNFWGVINDKDYHPGHPGYGYSNFKKGFGGNVYPLSRAKDYIYNPLVYSLLTLQEIYKKIKYQTAT